jgi:hypothetical protein
VNGHSLGSGLSVDLPDCDRLGAWPVSASFECRFSSAVSYHSKATMRDCNRATCFQISSCNSTANFGKRVNLVRVLFPILVSFID